MLNFFKKLFAGRPQNSTDAAPYKIETPVVGETVTESVTATEPDVWPFPGAAPGVPVAPVAPAAARKPRAPKAAKSAPVPAAEKSPVATADKKPTRPRAPRRPRTTS